SMDEKGEKGLEEERRLAYVGITRAREAAMVSFAANRLVYGRWTTQLPSRFVDELPIAHVDAASETGYYGGGPGMQEKVASRWDDAPAFTGGYTSPGYRRGVNASNSGWKPTLETTARVISTSDANPGSNYKRGDRVFHQKFGYGQVRVVDGAKLTVSFDKAGEKKVIDTFVEKA
ncbi:MAG: DNA helicase II, partial [Brevundimonas sp.]